MLISSIISLIWDIVLGSKLFIEEELEEVFDVTVLVLGFVEIVLTAVVKLLEVAGFAELEELVVFELLQLANKKEKPTADKHTIFLISFYPPYHIFIYYKKI